MKNIKLNKILLLLIILLCIGCILYICLTSFRKDKESTKKQIDEIEEYNYRLYETDLTQYKKLFHELKNILKSSTVDEEKYVQLIAKMFVMDFYTLQNKTSSDDVGGTDFIYSDVLSNFKEKSKDTLYLFLENELNHKEKLPSVDNVVIENIDTTLYTYLKKERK